MGRRQRRDRIAAFLLDGDVFSLSVEGLYTNSATAVTDVTAYRLPFHAVRSRLSADAALDLQIISKFVHELRASQRHAFILGERHADSKLAMFLQMLEQRQARRRQDVDEIYLPMSRQDIGEYLAVTPAAITRSFHNLSRAGVVSCRNLHHARVLDRRSFERVAAGNTAIKKTTRP